MNLSHPISSEHVHPDAYMHLISHKADIWRCEPYRTSCLLRHKVKSRDNACHVLEVWQLRCSAVACHSNFTARMYFSDTRNSLSPYVHLMHMWNMQPSIMLPEDLLWKSLFEEPAIWFDKRPTQNNRPAFVHSQHHYPLWLGHRTPREATEEVQRRDDLNEGRWAKVLEQAAVQTYCLSDNTSVYTITAGN